MVVALIPAEHLPLALNDVIVHFYTGGLSSIIHLKAVFFSGELNHSLLHSFFFQTCSNLLIEKTSGTSVMLSYLWSSNLVEQGQMKL